MDHEHDIGRPDDADGRAVRTSGVRGPVTALTDFVAYAYTCGFLQHLKAIGDLPSGPARVAVAGDLRSSTDRIVAAVCWAIEDAGHTPVNGGTIPSPALALYGLSQRCPAIMVTGSHIPDDRNGIKFNKCAGEILKNDEKGMAGQVVKVDDALFDQAGYFTHKTQMEGGAHFYEPYLSETRPPFTCA